MNVVRKKQRLDEYLVEQYPTYSRTALASFIMQGKVTVDGVVVTKAGTAVQADAAVVLNVETPRYVSRAGFKLERALQDFKIDPTGLVALDAGLSTGGFTDCLLQHGVARVYGVDVGYGQAHEKIRADARVIVMERTNLRHLESLPELVDIVTLDLSFISVLKVIEAVAKLLKPSGTLIILVKPQFEAGKDQVGKGGIVKDAAVHKAVLATVIAGITAAGFEHRGTIESPILGTEGNKEFLAYFVKK